MAEFRVGERAWIIPFQYSEIDVPGYWCTECTIIGPLERNKRSKAGEAYTVQLYDGAVLCASPRILRRPISPEELSEPRVAVTTSALGDKS